MIQVEKLDEKTQIIMETVDTTETVSIGFWFRSGSRDENREFAGFTHFLEHMLFKGTSTRTAFQIALEIDRVGGNLNAFTEKEFTCFYCTLPGEHVFLALDVLEDMIFNSLLDSVELEKEKTVVINEIYASLDTPEEVAQELFCSEMWKDHPLAWKIAGEVEDVRKITREKLDIFYRDIFLASPCVISVAGKFSVPGVKERLMRLARTGTSREIKRIPPVRFQSYKFVKDKFKQVQVLSGIQLPAPRVLEEYYSLLVLSTFIGEAMSSRLFQRIREELGLCYSIYSYRHLHQDTLLWMVYANTSREFVPALLENLNRELEHVKRNSISSSELEDARSHLKGDLLMAGEDMEMRMKRAAKLLFFTGEAVAFKRSFELLDSLTLEQVKVCGELLLRSGDFNLLTYGNRKIQWKNFRFTF